MKPLVIVGDIHGNVDALRQVLKQIEELDRIVIFVGDYINGGPASNSVLEELSTHKRVDPATWHFLAGNHDLALLDYLSGGSFAAFAALGGIPTLSAYLDHVRSDVRTAFAARFPKHHRLFLERLQPCFETDEILVSHVGFCVDRPCDRSIEAMAKGGNPRMFSSPPPRDLVVCGHYLQRSRRPFCSEHLICLDTGCGMADGPLTAVMLPERQFLSSN